MSQICQETDPMLNVMSQVLIKHRNLPKSLNFGDHTFSQTASHIWKKHRTSWLDHVCPDPWLQKIRSPNQGTPHWSTTASLPIPTFLRIPILRRTSSFRPSVSPNHPSGAPLTPAPAKTSCLTPPHLVISLCHQLYKPVPP